MNIKHGLWSRDVTAGKKLTHPNHIATIGIAKITKEVADMIRSGLILMGRLTSQSYILNMSGDFYRLDQTLKRKQI